MSKDTRTITINVDADFDDAIGSLADKLCGSKAALCKRWVLEGFVMSKLRGDYTLWEQVNSPDENGQTGKKVKK